MKKLTLAIAVGSLLLVGTIVLYAYRPASPAPPASTSETSPPAPPAPSIGATSATPTVIPVNTPTAVTVTSVITDPSLITTGINLLRLNTTGNPTVLGQLKDDGTNGDAVAGDKTFTIRLTFNETKTGQIQLQVSAAFRGVLKRAMSDVMTVNVITIGDQVFYRDTTFQFLFLYPSALSLKDNDDARSSVIYSKSMQSSDFQRVVILTVYQNPSQLDARNWFDQVLRGNEYSGFFGSGADAVASIQEFKANGNSGIFVEGNLVGYTARRILFSVGSRIVEFESVQPDDIAPSQDLVNIAKTFQAF